MMGARYLLPGLNSLLAKRAAESFSSVRMFAFILRPVSIFALTFECLSLIDVPLLVNIASSFCEVRTEWLVV